MKLKCLERPLVFIDIEGTGPDPAKDRIVSLSTIVIGPNNDTTAYAGGTWMFNPGIKMSDEVIAIHGISNATAELETPFAESALAFSERLSGVDFAGFNLLNYDVPILWEEFHRAGITWDLAGVRIIDVGNIFKKKEERTLSAAVKFYFGREHTGAHSSSGDAMATAEVMAAQLSRYPELSEMSIEELSEYSQFGKRFDLAGKIIVDAEGFPVYNIGKSKGVRVKDDQSFGWWMLGKDFSEQTKIVLREYLETIRTETVRQDEDRLF